MEPPPLAWPQALNAADGATVQGSLPSTAVAPRLASEATAGEHITAFGQRKPQQASLIMRCAKNVVEAAAEASALAKELGLDVTLGAPAIQALISTLYIQAAGARQ